MDRIELCKKFPELVAAWEKNVLLEHGTVLWAYKMQRRLSVAHSLSSWMRYIFMCIVCASSTVFAIMPKASELTLMSLTRVGWMTVVIASLVLLALSCLIYWIGVRPGLAGIVIERFEETVKEMYGHHKDGRRFLEVETVNSRLKDAVRTAFTYERMVAEGRVSRFVSITDLCSLCAEYVHVHQRLDKYWSAVQSFRPYYSTKSREEISKEVEEEMSSSRLE